MSTHCIIGVATGDGFRATYCHWNGYPSCNGKLLLGHWQDRDKVEQLIEMGAMSHLGKELGEKHPFEDYKPEWCKFYRRDRDEDVPEMSLATSSFDDLALWAQEQDGDWLYLLLDDQWLFGKVDAKRTLSLGDLKQLNPKAWQRPMEAENNKFRFPLANPTEQKTHLEVEVDYEKGGHNWFHGGTSRRGIYAYCRPIGIGGRNIVTLQLGAGRKLLLEELKRLDRRKVAAHAATVEKELREERGEAWQLVRKVCDEEKLELVEAN